MSTVVGFDTATADTAVCASRDGEVLYEELVGPAPEGGPRHSTALLSEIERAVEAAGGWDCVERIAVGLGPGSFVGIRIGIATALGLAAGTGLPVTGVGTLDALGRAIAEKARSAMRLPRIEGQTHSGALAVLDARRGEVFAALYSAAGERRWGPLVLAPEALAERLAELSELVLAAGSGAVRFRDELSSRDVEIPDDADPLHRIAARHVCALAIAAEGGGERLEPIYLRPPDAQRWRERDTSQRAG